MEFKIILFSVNLLLCNYSWAQVTKESFEKAVDLLNCKTVELSLKDDKSFEDYQQKCPCGTANYDQIHSFLTSIGMDKTVALGSEVDKLKKAFNANWKKADVVDLLSEKIFSDNLNYKKIYTFADKRKDKPEFNSYKADLRSKLSNVIVENKPSNTDDQTNPGTAQSDLEKRVAALEEDQKQQNEGSWFSGITSQLLVVSFFISLLVYVLFRVVILYFFNSDSDEVPDDIKMYVKRKIEEATPLKSTTNSQSNSSELKDANIRIRDLEMQIKHLNDKLDVSYATFVKAQEKQHFQESKQTEARSETFFLSTPNSDGSFNESSASFSHREGATIYRFTKIGNNKARFQIDEKDASAKLALQYPDKNIDPVCEAENAFNPKATQIITVYPGEAELQGDKWIINTKAKIRYEN